MKELKKYLKYLKQYKKDLHGVTYNWSYKLDNKILNIEKKIRKFAGKELI